MKLRLSLVFICCAIGFSFAQITSRVMIDGRISAPLGDNVEGVVVYNLTTKKGTITDKAGDFRISVGINDKVEVIGMQYQKIVVLVDKGVLDNRRLNIFLNESVNLLDEVIVTPYDLLGNVTVDVKKINVSESGISEVAKLTSSRINDTDYDWTADELSELENKVFLEDRMIYGLNFVNLFKEVFQNKDQTGKKKVPADIDVKVRKMYDDEFFKTNLALEMSQINDFIFFAEDNGLDNTYLEEGNELNLIEFLVSQSKVYKDRK
ncbi:carboxypeptidase-like regulatory domain-containing protein [Aquimarina sp. 2201CG14-23]|uniref:carboxypeptidase-like regulatory domain-containing protein n=1 Tax=Aquimarina mycalae TaxID=3040073 RepID=UPI0024781DFF|nr:carboxypeptidase-like regulatory domain-containing protein [Aquimarina sp. 2201CG14-23]MDH7445045.1 carboxypeptidase-like regulatory domain-containing protein [Aquimarina sp. 2201CG14-23]